MEIIKIYWNFTDKKWNLVEIGTEIPKAIHTRSYIIPPEAHFIDPRKSRLVRIAWRIHCFFKYIKRKANLN